ncbi:MAG: S41 family peptidase [Leptolyngbyaceae cyanobacterium MO_188.B28]|nr:S41 family peptidase [Leptolyngbyaceae cyanobacterium MO_188.B28]
MSKQSGYYRFPTIHGDRVVFVCEDDLWSVPATGGGAIRLTANLGEVSHPFLSPDGGQLAFVGRDEGNPEVYVMPAEGGTAKRLTFLGANSLVVGWSLDGRSILFSSNTAQPFRRISALHQIDAAGGLPQRLPIGPAQQITYSPAGGVAIGRHTSDIARWKRYRGGTAGMIWIDPDGTGDFTPLIDLGGNLASPMWAGDRIYFISDHEGIGDLYSCTPRGEDLQKHTNNPEYYVRNAATDGSRIVYQAGAELFCFDPASGSAQAIPIEFHSPQVQRQRKFVEAAEYLEEYTLHPEGHSTLLTCRGKSYWFGNWEGAVTQLGVFDGVRYRLTRWLNDSARFVTISDASGVEALEIHNADVNTPPERLEGLDLGRAIALKVSPAADRLILSNHRHELIWVNLETQQSRVLDRSDHGRIGGFAWSPDGLWVAYGFPDTQKTSAIKLCNVNSGDVHYLTSPRFWDFNPSFDPDGKFLYFLSCRDFNPVYDSLYFDLGFPRGMRPFLIALQKDTPSPFVPIPKPLKEKKSEKGPDKTESAPTASNQDDSSQSTGEASDTTNPSQLNIDLDGIPHRVVGFPVPEGRYQQIWGLPGKVLFSSAPIQGSLNNNNWTSRAPKAKAKIEIYDFEKQKRETVAAQVTSFKVGSDNETLIYRSGNELRVCAIAPQPKNGKPDKEPGRQTGWLDLKRVRLSVDPVQEWRQMFQEAWRLQREHFWVEDMSGVDWKRVYQRYSPLLEKVSSRSEFSDLIWEMQGELGTSHAYEIGGDYRESPRYALGSLGADFVYDADADAYRVDHIVQGDSWNERADSALNRLGSNVQPGDLLLAVGGHRVNRHLSPQELLVHQADCDVTLTFASPGSSDHRTITVKAQNSDYSARYREWVERNRQRVLEETGGRVGYVHVPDMGPAGYAEFHRYYAVEAERDGLIVDVRYNGGGHVSQLLLEKLSRQRIGYDVSRWGRPEPYPTDSVAGPILALTNEQAGSDGDIFSHCFKLMKLGTLIGKRTWGGVIGIWPRHRLVDGGILTQPEFSFWFKDVGWSVENYGTDPDIEVEITPQDWAQGKDPQMDKAIALVLEQLEAHPAAPPEFGDRPRLALPD